MDSTITEKLVALVEPAVAAEGCALFDLEFKLGKGSSMLRVYIDKDEGVGVEDCARVSRQLGFLLDTDDTIPGSYTLEVSSPGLTRALKTPTHFQKAVGKYAAITVRVGGPGGKGEKYIGIIENASEENIDLRPKSGEVMRFSYADIRKANLELEPGK
ncbi:MAG: ribosome maturation factor RimP [Nitrospinota bacterium]|nr:ribosome maturation factor RimP [Nitrospinota bacterium]